VAIVDYGYIAMTAVMIEPRFAQFRSLATRTSPEESHSDWYCPRLASAASDT
jgi:hypothetical protein